jgi:hypothetical protein
MPRAKRAPRVAPIGIDGATLNRDVFSDEFFEKLISAHLGTHSDHLIADVRKRLEDTLRLLQLGLKTRKRPTGNSKRAALSVARKALKTALTAILELDVASRKLVQEASEEDAEFQGRLEPDHYPVLVKGSVQIIVDRHGDDHVIGAVARIEALARWVSAAEKSIEPSQPGKTEQLAEFVAVKNLMGLWIKTKGLDPKEDELAAFATDALARFPGLVSSGRTLAGHVHAALYGKKPRGRSE